MEEKKKTEQLWALKGCLMDTRLQFARVGRIMSCQKGHLCFRAHEDNQEIYFILDGKVHIYNLTKCGKRKILFILGKDNIANENIAGSQNTAYCEALEPCLLYVLRQDALLSLMEGDFQLTKTLLLYQEKKIWRLEHQLKNTVGSINLEQKLASKLWKLARDFGVKTEKGIQIDLELSVTYLADLLGVSRENASRACKKLAGQGLISMEKRSVCIFDMEKLALFHKSGKMLL